MKTVRIFVTDTFQKFTYCRETFEHVKDCSVKSGMIHITFDDTITDMAGIHFPKPYNFSHIEIRED